MTDRIRKTTFAGTHIAIMGDPHLGRQFISGVPLHRRGEREASVLADFRNSLVCDPEVSFHICMGDLFDKWFVPYTTVYEASVAYIRAAQAQPDVEFIVLGGNHDIARDLEKKGALDLFELAVSAVGNISVIRHEPYFRKIGTAKAGFFPWHPIIPADQLVTQPIDVAFGHWDTIFGHDNMIPTEKFEEVGCHYAYTGHVHLPDDFIRDGVNVVQVGSLQPYAHGEDHGEMYVTLKSSELAGQDLRNKAVRIALEPGEVFAETVDCLQLTFKRAGAAEAEDAVEVSLGDFNIQALFAEAFEAEAVPDTIRSALINRFEEARVKE